MFDFQTAIAARNDVEYGLRDCEIEVSDYVASALASLMLHQALQRCVPSKYSNNSPKRITSAQAILKVLDPTQYAPR